MNVNRRDFIKGIGGGLIVAAAGASAVTVADALKAAKAEASSTESAGAVKSAVRWGMVIDVMKFQSDADYQKCINACHSIHNVPKFKSLKDEIKWIWKEKYENSFPGQAHQYVNDTVKDKDFLVLCNHCEKPPCVRVCPTKATFKSADGITQMDFHRCIGCRFCMAACPYGARSFNWLDPRPAIEKITHEFPTRERGVVEKCNFCTERLAKNLQPACVEASNGAIVFGNLNDPASAVRAALAANHTIQRKAELGTNPAVFYIV